VIEIEEAAFILEIPTKIASANHIAFIQAIFRHPEFLVKEALSEGHASACPRRAEACPSTGNPVRQAERKSAKSAPPQRVRLVADWKPNLY
jgi:hypothetical protein